MAGRVLDVRAAFSYGFVAASAMRSAPLLRAESRVFGKLATYQTYATTNQRTAEPAAVGAARGTETKNASFIR